MKGFFKLGGMSAQAVSRWLFWVGECGWLAVSWMFGKTCAERIEMSSVLRDGWEVPLVTYDIPKGILWGILAFLILSLIWRLICEIVDAALHHWKDERISAQCSSAQEPSQSQHSAGKINTPRLFSADLCRKQAGVFACHQIRPITA